MGDGKYPGAAMVDESLLERQIVGGDAIGLRVRGDGAVEIDVRILALRDLHNFQFDAFQFVSASFQVLKFIEPKTADFEFLADEANGVFSNRGVLAEKAVTECRAGDAQDEPNHGIAAALRFGKRGFRDDYFVAAVGNRIRHRSGVRGRFRSIKSVEAGKIDFVFKCEGRVHGRSLLLLNHARRRPIPKRSEINHLQMLDPRLFQFGAPQWNPPFQTDQRFRMGRRGRRNIRWRGNRAG